MNDIATTSWHLAGSRRAPLLCSLVLLAGACESRPDSAQDAQESTFCETYDVQVKISHEFNGFGVCQCFEVTTTHESCDGICEGPTKSSITKWCGTSMLPLLDGIACRNACADMATCMPVACEAGSPGTGEFCTGIASDGTACHWSCANSFCGDECDECLPNDPDECPGESCSDFDTNGNLVEWDCEEGTTCGAGPYECNAC